jgi:hypothetical protein
LQVEAVIALQMLLNGQKVRLEKSVEPHNRKTTLELLEIFQQMEGYELMIWSKEQLKRDTLEICQHLVAAFYEVMDTDESFERYLTGLGLLTSIETLIAVMQEYDSVIAHMEPIALQVKIE